MERLRAPQKRRQQTRDRLLEASRSLVHANGYAGFRVEDAVRAADVAKGTFFSHFADRDSLLAILIGDDLTNLMSELSERPAPESIPEFCEGLEPLTKYLARDRHVFDVIIRHSGALSEASIGPIAQNFGDQAELFGKWIAHGHGKLYRDDISVHLLAEGVQAFLIQAVSLQFCAIHNSRPLEETFQEYLSAWLIK